MVKKILLNSLREKEDTSDDLIFYSQPRFVYHLDKGFRNRLTQLYRERISEPAIILDLMSSWVSHLPEEIQYKKVIGHGMNKSELQRNNRLDTYWVQNLNQNTKLPLSSNSVDYCLVVAGWQYLQEPEEIAEEIQRIVKPGGYLIVSFSNRAFWSKAPRIWVESSDSDRICYISKVLRTQGWRIIESIQEKTHSKSFLGLLKIDGDPFLSVIAKS